MPLRAPRLLALAAAIAGSTLVGVAGPAAAGDGAFRVEMEMGASCVRVFSPPPGGTLTFIQKRGTKTVATDTTPAISRERACLDPLKVGDRIVLKQGGSTIRTVTIPRVTIAMDGTANTVTVAAPKGGSFAAYLEVTDVIAGVFIESGLWGITAEPDPGDPSRVRFTQDVGGVYDITGGDEAFTTWIDAAGNRFAVRASLPSVVMMNTIWKLTGRARNGTRPTITVKRGATTTASLIANASPTTGKWAGTVRKNGRMVPIEPGWKIFHPEVSGAMLTALSDIPLVDINGEGTLSQPCFPNGRWVLLLNGKVRSHGTTPADGQVEVASVTDGQGDLQPGDMIDFRCENRRGGGEQFLTGLSND